MRISIVLAMLVAAVTGMVALSTAHGESAPRVTLQQVVSGLSAPVQVTHAGDGSGRLFVVEQAGTVRVIRDGRLLARPFLDIRRRVTSGGELGLLSVAFHPRFASNGRFFVNYTTENGGLRSVIAEYRAAGTADTAGTQERVLLEVSQPFRNHNGGLNLFGPDGMLYIGLGDGGSARDPFDNGQRLDTLLGKVLRIDVNGGTPYRVPPDNPFVDRAGARPEVWAYGLRNPWRFSFDRRTGRLFLGDVGQNAWEEIDIVTRGGNYGWRIMEGTHCHNPAMGCDTTGLVLPIAEYPTAATCSVTGGHVYRGSRVAGLAGRYLFGDYCGGQMWALTEQSSGRWTMALLLDTDLRISSFGEDEAGELYVVDHGGSIHRLIGP